MNRITKRDVDMAFEAYVSAVRAHGIVLFGKPALFEGSKINGRAWRLFLVDGSGGQHPFPGIMGNGYLGMTAREAWQALWLAANVANDLLYIKQAQA